MFKYTHSCPIFNPNPPEGKPRQGGWKTVCGYVYEAKKLSHCLIANERLQGRRYSWHVTINIHHVIDDDEHKRVWQQATRVFRQNFAAFYIREPDRNNHVNYHLIIKSEISKGRLEKWIETAFPQITITSSIAPIYSTIGLCRYITKHGSKYDNKRLLFSEACTLNKHGSIGTFWKQPPKQIWEAKVKTERRLSATLNEGYHDIQRAAKYLHHLVGGYVKFRHIRRNLTAHYPGNEDATAALAAQWEPGYIDR